VQKIGWSGARLCDTAQLIDEFGSVARRYVDGGVVEEKVKLRDGGGGRNERWEN
jgi:hypothetical protein